MSRLVSFSLLLIVGLSGCGEVKNLIQGAVDDLLANLEDKLTPDEIQFEFPESTEAVGIAEQIQEVDRFILGQKIRFYALQGTGSDSPVTSGATTTAPEEQTATTNIVAIDAEGSAKPAANAVAEDVYVGTKGSVFLVRFSESRDPEVTPPCDPDVIYCPCASGEFQCNPEGVFYVGYYVPHDGSAGVKFQNTANRNNDNGDSTPDSTWTDFSDGWVVGENLAGDIVFKNADIFRIGPKKLEKLNTTVETPDITRASGNFVQIGNPSPGLPEGQAFVLHTETGERTFTESLIAGLDENRFIAENDDNLDPLERYEFGGSKNLGAISRTVTSSALFVTGEHEGTKFSSTITLEVELNLVLQASSSGHAAFAATDGAILISPLCATPAAVTDTLLSGEIPPYEQAALKCDGSAFPAKCKTNSFGCDEDKADDCPLDRVCLIRPDGSSLELVGERIEGDLFVSGDFYVSKTLTTLKFAKRGDQTFTTIFDNEVTITHMNVAGHKVYYIGEDNFGAAQAGVYDMKLKAGSSFNSDIALSQVFGIVR